MARVPCLAFEATMLAILSPATVAFAQDVTCYVDSQHGDDTRSGRTEAEPVKSQAMIGADCTDVRFRRGSLFSEALKTRRTIKTYANYGDSSEPLPKFVVPHKAGSGSVVSAYQGGITVDGLYLSGSMGDGTMGNLGQGVCVMLGANSKLLNSEITNCDIGIMLLGPSCLVQGNYVHDLVLGVDGPPGSDPNLVGGAEGIFINASDNEIAYNSFVNCKGSAEWTAGRSSCDGGAAEVTVGANKTLSNVRVHHNFSYNSCGFLEVATGFGGKGTLADSDFYENVIIDSGWLALLQVNNTNLKNIRFYNNTVVQHKDSTNAGNLAVVFTETSSGMSGGELVKGTTFLTNNLFIMDEVPIRTSVLNPNFEQTTNLLVDTSKMDPGVVNLKGTRAEDFDLTASSPAMNAGTPIPNNKLDYLNRTIPDVGGTDVGAFEFASPQVSVPPSMRMPIFSDGDVPPPSPGADDPSDEREIDASPVDASGDVVTSAESDASTNISLGQAAGTNGVVSNREIHGNNGGCACRMGQSESHIAAPLGLLGFAMLLRRRGRHDTASSLDV